MVSARCVVPVRFAVTCAGLADNVTRPGLGLCVASADTTALLTGFQQAVGREMIRRSRRSGYLQ